MRTAIVTLLLLAQSTFAQHMLTLRTSTDLTTPGAPSNQYIPSYDTWRNGASIGADLSVALAGPAFWVVSVEYTARSYSHFRHPFDDASSRTFGGDGRIVRGAIRAGVRRPVADRASVFALVGFEIVDARYDPVYYDNGIWWEDASGPAVSEAIDASARYAAFVGSVGINYRLVGPMVLAVDLSAHRDRSTGFYYRSSLGLGLEF